MNKSKKQIGFTLIELMIVMSIVGLLSTIAIPAYKNYVAKSEVISALATVKALQTPAELFYQENGISNAPDLNTDLGLLNNSNHLGIIQSVINNQIGQLIFEFTEESSLNGETLILSRAQNGGWSCEISKNIPKVKSCLNKTNL